MIVRVVCERDPTDRDVWFAAIGSEFEILDADWYPGRWLTGYEDGGAYAAMIRRLPLAGEWWLKVEFETVARFREF